MSGSIDLSASHIRAALCVAALLRKPDPLPPPMWYELPGYTRSACGLLFRCPHGAVVTDTALAFAGRCDCDAKANP